MADGINEPQAVTESIERPEFWTSMMDAIKDPKDPKKGVTAIAELATKNNGVPEDVIKKLSTWTDEQKKTLASFLSAESVEGVANEAREHLRTLAKTMNLGQVPEFGMKSTADTILAFVDGKLKDFGLKGEIAGKAKLLGFNTGNPTKFLKGFFVGAIAKGFERIGFAMNSYNPSPDNFKTPIKLRQELLGITDQNEKDSFKKAYELRLVGANYNTFVPPKNVQEAYAIVSPASKETLVAAKTQDASGKQPWELNPTTNTVGPPTTTATQNNPETKPNTTAAAV